MARPARPAQSAGGGATSRWIGQVRVMATCFERAPALPIGESANALPGPLVRTAVHKAAAGQERGSDRRICLARGLKREPCRRKASAHALVSAPAVCRSRRPRPRRICRAQEPGANPGTGSPYRRDGFSTTRITGPARTGGIGGVQAISLCPARLLQRRDSAAYMLWPKLGPPLDSVSPCLVVSDPRCF
jgi:hypothetical protein